MTGINVLSDSLKGGSVDKASSLKGKNAKNSFENATGEFAILLSALTNINANPIGQNTTIGQETGEEKEPDSFGQNLRLSHMGLSLLSQPIVMGDLPAGKEANSGNGVNQGTRGSNSSTDNSLRIDELLNMFSLNSNEVFQTKGMTSEIPQGNNPGNTELDKYRQVITDLLAALSGEITVSSPEDAVFVSENGSSERQEMMKLVQGWLIGRDNVTDKVQADRPQTIAAQGNNAQVAENSEEVIPYIESGMETIEDVHQAVPRKDPYSIMGTNEDHYMIGMDEVHSKMENPISTVRGADDLRRMIASLVQDWMKGTDETDEELNAKLQIIIKPLDDLLKKEQGVGSQELQAKVASFLTAMSELKSKVQGTNVPQDVTKEMFQSEKGTFESSTNQIKSTSHIEAGRVAENEVTNSESMNSDNDKSSELSGLKASPNQNSTPGIGYAGNILISNAVEGKNVSVPVWEQISYVVKEQALGQRNELKDLDIKLHPAELGRIHIGMRWENGQVHLLMHASEAATGQMLQNQLSDLRNTLTNQGVDCGMLQMGNQGGDQQQNQNHQGDNFHRAHNSYTEHNEDEDKFPILQQSSDGGQTNRINVTA